MSQTPTEKEKPAAYDAGWVAIHRMLREGASWSGKERDCAFQNLGDGTFADLSAVAGLDSPGDGRAVASCDWDLDGAPDLWASERTGPRVRFYRNRVPSGGRFVAFRLEGRTGNRDAIGARVDARMPGTDRRIVRTVSAGDSYLSQSSRWLLLPGGPDRVAVRWPGGGREEFGGLAAGRRYRLVEGSGKPEEWAAPGAATLSPSTVARVPVADEARVALSPRVVVPTLRGEDGAGRPMEIGEAGGKPTLLLLWASWCAPCLVELREFAAQAPRLRDAGVRVVAWSVDEGERRGTAQAFAREIDWPFELGFAGPDTGEILDALQRFVLERERPLPLPSSVLLDADGALVAIYRGRAAPETVAADARAGGGPAAVRAAAFPFAGRWHAPPAAADLAALEEALRARGLARAADEVARRRIVRVAKTRAQILYDFGMDRWGTGDLDGAIASFREAAALEVAYFEPRSCLGILLHRRGRVAEAIAAYRDAERLKPDHEPTLYNLGLALAHEGDREGAAARLERLRKVNAEAAERLAAALERARAR